MKFYITDDPGTLEYKKYYIINNVSNAARTNFFCNTRTFTKKLYLHCKEFPISELFIAKSGNQCCKKGDPSKKVVIETTETEDELIRYCINNFLLFWYVGYREGYKEAWEEFLWGSNYD